MELPVSRRNPTEVLTKKDLGLGNPTPSPRARFFCLWYEGLSATQSCFEALERRWDTAPSPVLSVSGESQTLQTLPLLMLEAAVSGIYMHQLSYVVGELRVLGRSCSFLRSLGTSLASFSLFLHPSSGQIVY